MKQYKFTIVVRSPMHVKDMVRAFTHKLKDAFKASVKRQLAKDVEKIDE